MISSIYIVFYFVAVSGAVATTPPTISFLDGNTDPVPVPKSLGARPHECIGNINRCPNGFTVSFNFLPTAGDPKLPAEYLLSNQV